MRGQRQHCSWVDVGVGGLLSLIRSHELDILRRPDIQLEAAGMANVSIAANEFAALTARNADDDVDLLVFNSAYKLLADAMMAHCSGHRS